MAKEREGKTFQSNKTTDSHRNHNPSANGEGWAKSGAYKPSSFPGFKKLSDKKGNATGSHVRLSGKHGTGAIGKHTERHMHGGDMVGGADKTFRKGLPAEAPCNYKGRGKKNPDKE